MTLTVVTAAGNERKGNMAIHEFYNYVRIDGKHKEKNPQQQMTLVTT